MGRKGSNPLPPDVSLRPPPSPAPPPKRNVIEIKHTHTGCLKDKLQFILDKIIEIEKTINEKQN